MKKKNYFYFVLKGLPWGICLTCITTILDVVEKHPIEIVSVLVTGVVNILLFAPILVKIFNRGKNEKTHEDKKED